MSDRLRPVGHQPRNVGDDDRLPEHHAAQDVADSAVGRDPHLLEVELLDPRFIRGDRGALHADPVLLDRVRRVDGHLVLGRIAIGDAKVVIVEVHIEIRMNQPVFDELPDDPCHLIAVDLDDRAFDLDLLHAANLSNETVRSGARLRR